MKRLFYLTGSVFFLACTLLIGFHLGQQTAEAQSSAEIIGYSVDGSTHFVILSSGDIWSRVTGFASPPSYVGNFFDASPVTTEPTTWGKIKADHKDGDQ